MSIKQVLIINSGSDSLGISEGDAEAIVGTLSLTGSNSGVIDTHIISTNADGAWSVTTGDVDGDGDIDVLSASDSDGKIAWYENDGNGVFTEKVISTNADGAGSVTTADLDGDGDLDVLSASSSDDKIAWYENDGNEVFTEQVISTNADSARSVTTSDVDGDGDMDVLSASSRDNKIAWYENDGNGVFTEKVISTNADGADSVTTADVDGDGDMDVLSASWGDDKIAWYENDGNGVFTEKVISTNADGADSVTTADVDGDGDLDVLSTSYWDDKIAWYENDGNEVFTEKVISTNAAVATADVDGDGDLDVLSASYGDDKIAWYENDGNEVFTEQVISTNADSARSVTTADLDGDGDLDVLSASSSRSDNKIAWYDLNLAPQFSLSGEDADQFEIVDQELKLKTGVVTDYETKSSYSVTVIATDPDGTDYSKDFDITIKDVAETPTGINFLDSLSGVILPKSSSFSDNYLVSQEVPIGNSVLGSIDFVGDTDWFSVELEKDSRYQIDWDFMGDTSITESPELKLYDSQRLLVPIEIGEKGFTCRPSQSGNYYLSFADNISNDVLYDYSLSIGYEKFTHTINITNPSLFGSYYDDVVACLDVAMDLWAEEIVQTGGSPAVIEVDVTGEYLETMVSAYITEGDQYRTGVFYGDQNITKTPAQLEITSGIDKDLDKAEGFMTVNTRGLSNLWWFDPTPTNRSDNTPPSTKYDFITVMLHEFGHSLGFSGLFGYEPPPSGLAGLFNNDLPFLSVYDTFIDWDEDQSSFVFTGENAVKAYQELGFSGNLPLHSEGNNSGSDLRHYGSKQTDSDPLNLYLMDATSNSGKIASISTLDTAILKDLGYRINESEKLTESIVEVELQVIPIVENIPGAVVALLETVDADINDPHVYTLSGTDAVFFEVSGQQLKLKEGVDSDYETKSSYDLTITTTDSSNLSYSEDIIVEVVNVVEGIPKTLSGTSGNDTLDGFSGYYTLDGKGGLDVAKYSVVSDAVSFSKNGAGQLVVQNTSNSSESDILVSMERIQFSDKNYALDLDGNTGIAAKAIIATFGADTLSTHMATVVPLVDAGYTLDGLCDVVVQMGLIESQTGSSDMSSFVEYVYGNVVARELDAFEKGMIGNIVNGPYSKSDLLKLAVSTVGIDSQVSSNAVDLIGVPGSVDGELLAYLI